MKLHRIIQHFSFLLILLTAYAGSGTLWAQAAPGQPAPEPSTPKELPLGIKIGATVSVLPFNPLPDVSTQTSTSDPVSQTTVGSRSTSNPVGAGAYVEVPIHSRVAVQAGFILRSISFNAGTETVTGDDGADTADEDWVFTSSLQRTRARYWEVPLVLRVYDSANQSKRLGAYVEGGVAYRIATVTETYREFTDAEGEVTRDRSPASLENSTHYGAVLGAGLRARSSGRIALMPGLRFTRWFSPTIVDGPTRSTKNQVEFLLSITF